MITIKKFQTEEDFLLEFSREDNVKSRLITMIHAANSADKIFQRALSKLTEYLSGHTKELIPFHNEFLNLRSENLERFEENIPISRWNKISDMISKNQHKKKRMKNK